MLGIHDYWLFAGTGILINLIPGQDTLFILGRALSGGQRAGISAALGIAVGSLCHTLAAALGFSALIAASATAFTVIKLAGAAYLIVLGVRLLCVPPAASAEAVAVVNGGAASAWQCFRQGVVTNVLNPKVALFFLALLPQFIDPASPSKPVAFLALGATFVVTGTLWCLVIALAAARLRSFFARNPAAKRLMDRLSGALFVTLGIRLAWSR
jgi:threonine/homoserine/homoserine lactone efflux protein